ncbi:MAG: hypothetical protein AAF214_01080 [Pseudomonadota bacterium]
MTPLDARLLAAHTAQDTRALVDLYQEAAAIAPTEEARGFYLTHAHVFALEMGHPDVSPLRAALIELGRETPV